MTTAERRPLLVARARRAFLVYGPGGIPAELARRALGLVLVRESHVWYRLDLHADLAVQPLPAGLVLDRGGERDIPDLQAATGIGPRELVERLRGGTAFWLVRDGAEVAFACWTFRARTPAVAARGGWLALDDDVVCLEDSTTSPAFRGRGVAPAAWTAIARALTGEGPGLRTMITKVGETNSASRRAVEKAAFVEFARMSYLRVGPLPRAEIRASPNDALAAMIERQLVHARG
jgi:GNAT superfamily N-acetyltransferase